MFGYVKADLCKLNEENTALYKTVYCSLCLALKEHYGQSARLLLNYDVTFLALVLLNEKNEQGKERLCYCAYKHKKCRVLEDDEKVFFFCASVLIILMYEKILDTIRDEKWFRRLGALVLKLIFKRKYLKAKENYPLLCDKIRQNMIQQVAVESADTSADRAAHPSADALGTVFSFLNNDPLFYRFGYLLGRWVYFTDAAEDLESDIKKGRFNPFISGYDDKRIEEVLNLSIGEAASVFSSFSGEIYRAIIENILYEGSLKSQAKALGKEEESESISNTGT